MACDYNAFLWKCLCDCGNVCYHSRYTLISDNAVKSCGCLYKDTRTKTFKKYCKYDLDSYDFGVGYCSNGTYFFFDKEDYDKIKQYGWWYDGRYVCAHTLESDNYTTKIIRLHRLVMDIADREDINVDHKNLIRYDCRKINLRKANDIENARNKDVSSCSKTGVVGVRKINENKYSASIKTKEKVINLGVFDTLEKAKEARLQAEIKYFGEFRFDLSDKDIIDETKILLAKD